MLDRLRSLFRKPPGRTVKGPGIMLKSYEPAYLQTDANFDFLRNSTGEDGNLYAALRQLRQQSRALAHTNGIYGKFDQAVRVNVIGEGYVFQSLVWDKPPRTEGGKRLPGEPDAFVNDLIERRRAEWEQAEYCTVRGDMPWQQVRELRLSMTARDGAVMTRKIKLPDAKTNPFAFTTQLLNIDCLAHDYNRGMENGTEIRMGIERDGYGRKIRYWMNAKAEDWRWNSQDYSSGKYIPIPAEDIVLSTKLTDADATLAAPWCTPVMQQLYQLDEFVKAELIACRAAACKGGYFKNTMSSDDPSGLADAKNSIGDLVEIVGPNESRALPYGWEFVPYDPKHPSANLAEARKTLTQAVSVGLRVPYYTLSGDLADANYSSLRVGEVDVRENWKLTQKWDIECNELPINRALLSQSLLSGALSPLPASKFDKFHKPYFRGRRWSWVDPVKEIEAYEKALRLGVATRTEIISDRSQRDFEEVVGQLATEDGILAASGLECLTLKALLFADQAPATQPASDDDAEEPAKKPKAKSKSRLNGEIINK